MKQVIVDIRNLMFPEVTVPPNTEVVWRNLDPIPHSAETLANSSYYFNAGPMRPGAVSSPVLFRQPGRFEYICRFHAGMSGVIVVSESSQSHEGEHSGSSHQHGGHDHLKHFHGFVTGGRSAKRLFMTHTPVIADERHHFQVILQGSIANVDQASAYDKLRNSTYGHGKVQIFHDHLSLADIGSGAIKLLPNASFEYYPDGVDAEGKEVPGLGSNVVVNLDKVLHFHQFDPDAEYPPSLTYLMYGDAKDAFIDHYIDRAPSFHSVAKLKAAPSFWNEGNSGSALEVTIPSKRIRDVSPRLIERVAFVDNAFHVIWLPPSGMYLPPPGRPQDPLIPRDNSAPVYEVIAGSGAKGKIEIDRWLHFDVRLLNFGVLIT
jgi:hypothetical protein